MTSSRRWFVRGLTLVFVLFLGGCVAVLVSVDNAVESLSGEADPAD